MTETAIADHALIGDLQTAALVTTDGSVDWLCLPRFDSPSVFGALLDDERGGHFRIHPAGIDYTTKQMYFPDTAVLVTRFFTEAGVGQVVDFMPPAGDDGHRHPPARPDGAVRARPDELRRRRRPAVRLRPPPAPDRGHRGRRRVRGERLRADPARGARARRRAEGPRHRRGRRPARLARPGGGRDPRHGAGVGGRTARRASSGWRRSGPCSTRRCGSGGRGWPGRPTPAGGARRSSARRSR